MCVTDRHDMTLAVKVALNLNITKLTIVFILQKHNNLSKYKSIDKEYVHVFSKLSLSIPSTIFSDRLLIAMASVPVAFLLRGGCHVQGHVSCSISKCRTEQNSTLVTDEVRCRYGMKEGITF